MSRQPEKFLLANLLAAPSVASLADYSDFGPGEPFSKLASIFLGFALEYVSTADSGAPVAIVCPGQFVF
jgi:hypothetical protein